MVIWEHEGNVENTSRRWVFSTFIECFQMTGVFYHSVIHGLGFFICLKYRFYTRRTDKTRFFYVLYSDETWVFDQSERAQGPIYILMEIIVQWTNDLGSTKFVTKPTHPKSVYMHPNIAHVKIHPNSTMATSLFRPSKIQDDCHIQDGRHFWTKIKIKQLHNYTRWI